MNSKPDNLYHLHEEREQRFYQVPKQLLGNTYYNDLSSHAKLLYSILQDRMELSRKNGWVNEKSEIYLKFTRENLAKLMDISRPTVTKAMNELKDKELVYEERPGCNKANKIYIGKIDYDKGTNIDLNKKVLTGKNVEILGNEKSFTSRSKNTLQQETKDFNTSDTDLSDTDLSDKKGKREGKQVSSYYFYENKVQNFLNKEYDLSDLIRENIEYYLDIYEKIMKEKHPPMKINEWDKIFINITHAYDGRNNTEVELLDDIYKNIVNKHFETQYQKGCDYRLLHFISGNIIMNRYYEIYK